MTLTMIWLKTKRLFQSHTIIPNSSMIKMLSQSVTLNMLDTVSSSILYSDMPLPFYSMSTLTMKR